MKSRIAPALLLLVICPMLVSCDHGRSKQHGAPDGGPAIAELQGTWVLSSISGTRIELPDPGAPTLHVFDDGEAQAIAGCRVAGVGITSQGTTIEMTWLGVGRMRTGCFNGLKDPTRGAFFQALRAVDTVAVSETKLRLSDEHEILLFEALPSR